jgi:hypothetical protein
MLEQMERMNSVLTVEASSAREHSSSLGSLSVSHRSAETNRS